MYTSVSVGEKNYIITVRTNWTSVPKVFFPETESKYVNCDFIGPNRETISFNITIPTELIWGSTSLVWKYCEQNANRYFLSNNGTHNSLQMTFYHTATIEHFEIDEQKELGEPWVFLSSLHPVQKKLAIFIN